MFRPIRILKLFHDKTGLSRQFAPVKGAGVTDLIKLASEAGFSRAVMFDPAILKPLPEVRDMCRADRCHVYGKNWSCPPGSGTLQEAAAIMRKYPRGILVQSTGQLWQPWRRCRTESTIINNKNCRIDSST